MQMNEETLFTHFSSRMKVICFKVADSRLPGLAFVDRIRHRGTFHLKGHDQISINMAYNVLLSLT